MTDSGKAVMISHIGELAALSAALIWAVSSVVYAGIGRQISPLMLNFLKGAIAIALLVATLFWSGQLLPSVPWHTLGLLGLSGAIGIGLGDTAYFVALNHLGARRSLILESLAPPLAALLALIGLQEQLAWISWLGILLTIAGVTWVVLERIPVHLDVAVNPGRGISFGVVAAAGQAIGAVLSRAALVNTDINPLWSALIRISAGVLVLVAWLVIQSWQIKQPILALPSSLKSWRFVGLLIAAAFASTYLGIWLQQIALKYAPTGVAQSLSATSPLFVIPIVLLLGERVSFQAVVGVIVAIAGIWLLLIRP